MLPLSYLDIPQHLTIPDEITDQILEALSYLSRSRLSQTVEICSELLHPDSTALAYLANDQKLALYALLAVSHKESQMVHYYRRKSTWIYEESLLEYDSSACTHVTKDRSSALMNEEEKRWNDEKKKWIDDVGDLLTVLTTYQSELETLIPAWSRGFLDESPMLEKCRRQVVISVGSWFGRIEKDGKRVSFVLADQLDWREDEILDVYAGNMALFEDEDEHILNMPNYQLALVDKEPRSSTDTTRPGNTHEKAEPNLMAIEWPIAKGSLEVKSITDHHNFKENSSVASPRQHKWVSQWPLVDLSPHLRYNDPNIIPFAKKLPVTPTESYNEPYLSNNLDTKHFNGHTLQISRVSSKGWSLEEHYIPSNLPKYHPFPNVTPGKAPKSYKSMSPIPAQIRHATFQFPPRQSSLMPPSVRSHSESDRSLQPDQFLVETGIWKMT
jgi:hypothetical protein